MILFLDFDGVTHPFPCWPDNVFCCLPIIEEVLWEFRRVEIVISSSWREHHSLDEMRGYFSADLRERVIGVTPGIRNPSSAWLPDQAPEFEREWEIEAWREDHGRQGERWLAIDDQPDWFRAQCPDLLVTDAATGFCDEDQSTLRAMIRERL